MSAGPLSAPVGALSRAGFPQVSGPLSYPRAQGCQAGSTARGTRLPGAWQVKTSLTFVHTCSRRNDSMLWLQSLWEDAGGS